MTSPPLHQAVTRWMHLCADTSMKTFATDLSCCQMEQRLTPLKPRSRAANGSMADHSSIPAGKVVSSFEHLRDFIRKRMRMAHIYQPVMIKELLTSGGKSSIRTIAAAFLARDASQLEYYEQITKDMPGKVLAKHGIVERDGKDYRLSTDPSSLSSEQRDELVRLCDEAISTYLKK